MIIPILLCGQRKPDNTNIGKVWLCAGGCGRTVLVTGQENMRKVAARILLPLCSKCVTGLRGFHNIGNDNGDNHG